MVIKHLISVKKEIGISINGEKTAFTSRILKINQDDLASSITNKAAVIIDKLQPDKGNALIQSTSKVILSFLISEKSCRCSVEYLGISTTAPYIGFFLKIPETVEIIEKRYEERVSYEISDFVSAEFKLEKGSKEEKVYELNAIDCSSHGLGLIISERDFDLLQRLKIGDRIKDMMFFAPRSMVKVKGIVRHITKIEVGEYKGSYQLGIESADIINTCKPKKSGK